MSNKKDQTPEQKAAAEQAEALKAIEAAETIEALNELGHAESENADLKAAHEARLKDLEEALAEEVAETIEEFEKATTIEELEAVEFDQDNEDLQEEYTKREAAINDALAQAAEADAQAREAAEQAAAEQAANEAPELSGKTEKLVPLYNMGVGSNGVDLVSGKPCDVAVEDVKRIGSDYFRKPTKKDEPKKAGSKKK